MIADRAKKKLQSGQFREGRSGYRKQELFFFWPKCLKNKGKWLFYAFVAINSSKLDLKVSFK